MLITLFGIRHKKLHVILLCFYSGLFGAWISRRIHSTDTIGILRTTNEAALVRLHTSACNAYWQKKNEVAPFALKLYIDFGKYVGRARLASVDDEAGEWVVAYLRLVAIENELNHVELADQYTKNAQRIAASSDKFKTWTLEAMQTLTQRLDSNHTP